MMSAHDITRVYTSFLFSAPEIPQHLLPFPTRRSSDLSRAPKTFRDRPRARLPRARPPPWPGATAASRPRAIRPSAISARDRKSTRLNSSHLGISYAVFCLKKKKQTELDRRDDHEKASG